MSNELVNVGVAQIRLGSQDQILRTILGSCVGICIYDRMKKMGGLAHILLPDSTGPGSPEKFAQTAIPMLIEQLVKQGCRKEFMSAKIAGGASMFKFKTESSLGLIGERNIEMVRKVLKEVEIPILAEDVGGNAGRVIDLYINDGHIKVKAAGVEQNYYKV
jgi:chemotaxis protein CheD